MHILHGTWRHEAGYFAIWGEDALAELTLRKGRRGATAPHPFALSIGEILRYVDRFGTNLQPDGDEVIVWLPGAGKVPQPSPQALEAGVEPSDADLDLLAWQMSVVTLKATDALDFLLQLPSSPRGFLIGDDLAYWQQAALLAMTCLVEGRYIPALKRQSNQYTAHWEALPDKTTFAQLAENMAPLARAMVENVEQAENPKYLLNHFLSGMVDAFVRDYDHKRRYQHTWMRALTGADRRVRGSDADNRRLYEAWESWRATGDSGGTFRVCFRLNEPESRKSDDWQLDYLLQATDEASLLVDASVVWAAKANRLDYLERRFDRPQEKLLSALGLASRVFAPIERSLRHSKPTGVLLTREEAYQFLTDAVALLEANGFGVLVPNWWGKQAKLRARAQIKGQANNPTGILTREALMNYSWQLSLGGHAISREEFEQLVALKQPIVQYKDEWVTLDPEQVEAALKFFEKTEKTEGQIGLLDALKLSADETEVVGGLEIEQAEVTGWLNDIFEQLRNPQTVPLPDDPDGLKATLRPYQKRGFAWLAQMAQLGLGACLADDMGLGKTVQNIALLVHRKQQAGDMRPSLIVAPTSVVGNWQHEIKKFAPELRVYKHQGADRLRDDAFIEQAQSVDVVLTSYALIHRDLEFMKQVAWSTMAIDEAQNIKNSSTKQAQAARAIPADHKIALTGTPVENRLTELWSIFQFLNPGYLGSQKAFKSNFATPIERYGDPDATKALKQLTAPFILRRVKTDPDIIQDLPDKFENKAYCSLTEEQATLYEATVRDEMQAIENADDDLARRGGVLRMLTRLKQICNHPAHYLKEGTAASMANRSGKLQRLIEMLDEVREQDERALIFTQYAEMGELLQTYLRDYLIDEVLFLHGGTPAKKRDEMVRQFQSPHGPPVFILSLKAGGTGLTLTNANHVFHFDRWYNPAVENQATDRAFRIGQTKNVQVHKFICLGTLEERIDELIEHKQALADSVVGAGESWLSELDNRALNDLVQLRRDAVAGD